MNVLCVSSSFPTKLKPWRGPYVRNFCINISQCGNRVLVILPINYLEFLFLKTLSLIGYQKEKNEKLKIHYAPFFSLTRLSFNSTLLSKINYFLQKKTVYRELSKIPSKPDFVYAHSLGNALMTADWCIEHNVPLIVISGESDYNKFYSALGVDEIKFLLCKITHLFFVSDYNQTKFQEFIASDSACGSVLPNSVDCTKFYKHDKHDSRLKLGLPHDAFILIFVGYFIVRKGTGLVSRALNAIDNAHGIFIGIGPIKPSGPRHLHIGPAQNHDLPLWLSASDVFVLPSQEEGMANAILEALACELPVIVSDKPFNREFLDDSCALFVDPNSVDSIRSAIVSLMDSPSRRLAMQKGARLKAEQFSTNRKVDSFLKQLQAKGIR